MSRTPWGALMRTLIGVSMPTTLGGASIVTAGADERKNRTAGQTNSRKITSSRSISLFSPGINPIENCCVPKDGVLRLQHPVPFVGKQEQLGRDLLELQR